MAMMGKAMTIPLTIRPDVCAALLTRGRTARSETAVLGGESNGTRDHAPKQPQIAENVIKQAVADPFPVEIGERKDSHQEEGHRNGKEDRHRLEADKGHCGKKSDRKQEQARPAREAKPSWLRSKMPVQDRESQR